MESARNWYKKGEALLEELGDTHLPRGFAALWYLGQSGFALKTGETLCFFDPVLADLIGKDGATRRYYPAPCAPEDAAKTGVSYVFCTHDHLDHLQPDTLAPLAKAQPSLRIVVPAPSVGKVISLGVKQEQVIGARAQQPVILPDGSRCVPIPAAHEQYETDENGDDRALSYLFVTADGLKLFHAGDTVVTQDLTERLQQEQGLDVAMLPINGADPKRRRNNIIGNMNSREAADLAWDIDADLVIPCHYDMTYGNGEAPSHFADYMDCYYSGRKYHMMQLGERYLLCR